MASYMICISSLHNIWGCSVAYLIKPVLKFELWHALPYTFSCVVQVNLHESASSSSQIRVSCSATSNTDYGIKFYIVAMDRATNSTVSTSELIPCTTNTHTLEIGNTFCSREYSVYARFSFPNGSRSSCQLSNTTTITTGVCPTSDTPTEGKL